MSIESNEEKRWSYEYYAQLSLTKAEENDAQLQKQD
jgi:hypothetical protein